MITDIPAPVQSPKGDTESPTQDLEIGDNPEQVDSLSDSMLYFFRKNLARIPRTMTVLLEKD